MPQQHTILSSGEQLPTVGLGTWNIGGETVRSSVESALDVGYTHIDTAEGYGNEAVIGEAIADINRDDLFLTSKVLPKNLHYGGVIEALDASLQRLGTDYLDLYLIHWPNPAISLRETLNALETLYEAGKVRHIGVSNFTGYQLSVAQHITNVPIEVNQIEFHPRYQRRELVEYCQDESIVVEAAAPLARMAIPDEPTIQKIADEYEKTPVQIVLRWAIEEGVVVLPKSTSPAHIEENLSVFDWELDEADHQRINDLDRGEPVYDTLTRDWSQDVYGLPE